MFIIVLIAAGMLTGMIQLAMTQGFGNISTVCSTLLLHQFVVTFGLIGVIGTITNIIKAEDNAKVLGWPGGPFQIKYGFSQLGLGVMGIMCIWFQGGFWLGTLVSMYIYGISGFWSHIAEMKRQGKATVNDVGNLMIDVVHQTMLTVLSIYAGGIWA